MIMCAAYDGIKLNIIRGVGLLLWYYTNTCLNYKGYTCSMHEVLVIYNTSYIWKGFPI